MQKKDTERKRCTLISWWKCSKVRMLSRIHPTSFTSFYTGTEKGKLFCCCCKSTQEIVKKKKKVLKNK